MLNRSAPVGNLFQAPQAPGRFRQMKLSFLCLCDPISINRLDALQDHFKRWLQHGHL